jgi:hypothetical protein
LGAEIPGNGTGTLHEGRRKNERPTTMIPSYDPL